MTCWDAMVMLSRMIVTLQKARERRAYPKAASESKSNVPVNIDQR